MVDLFKQSKQSINNLRYKFDQGGPEQIVTKLGLCVLSFHLMQLDVQVQHY